MSLTLMKNQPKVNDYRNAIRSVFKWWETYTVFAAVVIIFAALYNTPSRDMFFNMSHKLNLIDSQVKEAHSKQDKIIREVDETKSEIKYIQKQIDQY